MRKRALFILTLMLLVGAVGARAAEAYTYFDSSNGRLTFCYDNNKSSISSKYTVYSLNTGTNNPAWRSIASSVKELYFNSDFANYRPTSCYGWAQNMTNLTKVTNISNLNTSSVTTMAYMFKDCSSLTFLDLNWSKFVTTNVTSMGYMFYGCSKLTTLYLGYSTTFNTANVTDFGFMFYGCSSLSSIRVSNFNTAKATYMVSMFKNCSGITSIDVSNFNTANAKSWMNEMFSGCSKLTSLDLSSFTIGSASGMLSGCSSLTYLKVPSSANNLPSNACSGVGTVGNPCTLDYPNGFTPSGAEQGDGYFKWKSGYFKDILRPYAVLNGSTLTFYYDYKWFYGMSKITGITGLNYLKTEEVSNFESMFEGCTKLASVDLSGFTTYENQNWYDYRIDGINFKNMFKDCTSLTSLDLSNILLTSWEEELDDSFYYSYYHKSKVLYCETDNMFSGCTTLKKLSLPVTYEPQEWTEEEEGSRTYWEYWATMNDMDASACQGVGTQSSPCELIYPSWFTPEPTSTGSGWYMWKGGYFKSGEDKAYAVLSGSTLKFYYDGFSNLRTGTIYNLNTSTNAPAWNASASTVKTVEFDESFGKADPTSCYRWFYNMTGLTAITGIENLKTSSVTNMSGMFQNCSSLTSLDLGTFNTAKVTNMSSMFSGCTKLGKLILYSDLGYMGNCEEYETEFVTTKVTNMKEMFKNCKALTTLQFPGLALTSSTTTTSMFSGCSAVTYFSVANNLTNAPAATFAGLGTAAKPCVLYSEYLPTDAKYTPTYLLWKGGYFKDKLRQAYAVYEESNKTLTFYYDNPEMWEMSEGGFSIYYMDNSTNTPKWNAAAKAVTKVVFTNDFKYVRPTNCQKWFWDMSNLTTITGLNFLDTSEVEYMESMFWGCSRLKTLDLSSFNTEKVTTMRGMFSNCESLATLDLSSFNTEKVVAMNSMFLGCESLSSLDLSKFNTANVVNMNAMFLCCKKLSNLNLSSFNTAKVRDMSEMFYGCESLTSLDVSKFIIPANTRMMFTDCSGLKWLSIPSTASQLVYDEEFLYDPCQGVGTQAAPCTLVYPSGFTPEKTATGNGWYMWKGGYFKDADSYAMGDVNHDRAVSVVDVMLTVDYVLGNRPNVFYRDQADISNDGIITVADVISIVDLVLNSSPKMPRDFRSSAADRLYLAPAEGQCQLLLDNSEPFAAMQFTIVVPEGAKVSDIALEAARANGHSVRMQQLTPTRYNVVVFAANGEPLRNGEKALLRFDIDGCQPDDIDIEEAQLVNGFRETVQPDFGGVATGIAEIATDGDTQPYYNTVGVKVKTPNRGVYIHNGRKVVVK